VTFLLQPATIFSPTTFTTGHDFQPYYKNGLAFSAPVINPMRRAISMRHRLREPMSGLTHFIGIILAAIGLVILLWMTYRYI
jgi:hypothetical protein